MPLVTLTCSPELYPPDRPRGCGHPTLEQNKVLELAHDLPNLLIQQAGPFLEAETPPEAVQVDIRQFHHGSVNTCDLWVEVRLTEADLDSDERGELRNALVLLLRNWLGTHRLPVSWALDVFFGPGHGVLTNSTGIIIQHW